MIKYKIPVVVLIVAVILLISSFAIHYINRQISDIFLFSSFGIGLVSFVLIVIDKSNSIIGRIIISLFVLGLLTGIHFFKSNISDASTWLYIEYYHSELQEIRELLYDKGDYNSEGPELDHVPQENKRRVNEIKRKIDCNYVFSDSNKIGYNIVPKYVIVYSDKPIEGCLYNEYNKEYTFKTRKLFGNWYAFNTVR